MMNDTTFSGNGKVSFIPVITNTTTQPQTNADRIRAMTDEELADFINDTEFGFIDRPGMCDVCDHHRMKDCLRCWLDWLKSPVEVDE